MPRTPQDNAYKSIFSHPAMVRDLLRGFVREAWVEDLDFDTLEKVTAKHLSDDLRGRESDLVWRIRLRGQWLYVYLLLEFQSTVDSWMALRVTVYTGLLYQELIRTGAVRRGEKLPPVFPIVIYNGRPRWTSARDTGHLIAPLPRGLGNYRLRHRYFLLDEARADSAEGAADVNMVATMIRIETLGEHEGLASLVGRLAARLSSPDHASLRRSLTAWLNQVIVERAAPGDNPLRFQDLQEAATMLEETVDGWIRKAKRQGLAEGRKEGRQEGRKEGSLEGRRAVLERLLVRRFGEPLPGWAQACLADADTLLLDRWAEELLDAPGLEALLGQQPPR